MADIKRGGAQLAEAVKKAYELGQDDYHLEPMVLVEDGKPVGKIAAADAAPFSAAAGASGRSSSPRCSPSPTLTKWTAECSGTWTSSS